MNSTETNHLILEHSTVHSSGPHIQSFPETNLLSLTQQSPNSQSTLQLPEEQFSVSLSSSSNEHRDLEHNMPIVKDVNNTSDDMLGWLSPEYLHHMKGFLTACEANPDILNIPQFTFFKDYIESLGANVLASKVKHEYIPTPQSTTETASADAPVSHVEEVVPGEYDKERQWENEESQENCLDRSVEKWEFEGNGVNYGNLSKQHSVEKIGQRIGRHSDAKVLSGKKKFQCHECGKAFPDNFSLKTHLMIHTGERPYQCHQCGKAFSYKHILTRHTRVHTGERPYQCIQCGKAFSDESSLKKHMMIHTGERPYQCTHCDKTFSFKHVLTRHTRTHTGEQPYQCIQCEKKFSNEHALKKHLRIHTGERPYQCSQCGKTFVTDSALTYHMVTHTGERPYQCDQCGKSFSLSGTLKNHMKTHTGEIP